MAILQTVQDYVTQSRILLQDMVVPYRYDDESLVTALNMAFYELARLRPDVVLRMNKTQRITFDVNNGDLNVPNFTTTFILDVVPLSAQFRMPVLYFICGYAQLRDTEDTQDNRAAAFMAKFVAQLTTAQA